MKEFQIYYSLKKTIQEISFYRFFFSKILSFSLTTKFLLRFNQRHNSFTLNSLYVVLGSQRIKNYLKETKLKARIEKLRHL